MRILDELLTVVKKRKLSEFDYVSRSFTEAQQRRFFSAHGKAKEEEVDRRRVGKTLSSKKSGQGRTVLE